MNIILFEKNELRYGCVILGDHRAKQNWKINWGRQHERSLVLYNRWAMELAKTAHAGFTYTVLALQIKKMYWKMSIDLSRPLVSITKLF